MQDGYRLPRHCKYEMRGSMSDTPRATADIARASQPGSPPAAAISGYGRILGVCAGLGALISLLVFVFLTLVQQLTNLFWQDLPRSLGWQTPPWWWSLPALLVAG